MDEQQSQPVQQPVAGSGTSNSLGTAGFVVSLIGLLSCGFLSPIGLLLSLIGLKRQPRGLATAGAVIGGIGSIGLVVALVVGFGAIASMMGFAVVMQKQVETHAALQQADVQIEQYRAEHENALPETDEGQALIAECTDGWGNALKYERKGEEFDLISAGPDGRFGTPDDVDSGESTVPPPMALPID